MLAAEYETTETYHGVCNSLEFRLVSNSHLKHRTPVPKDQGSGVQLGTLFCHDIKITRFVNVCEDNCFAVGLRFGSSSQSGNSPDLEALVSRLYSKPWKQPWIRRQSTHGWPK